MEGRVWRGGQPGWVSAATGLRTAHDEVQCQVDALGLVLALLLGPHDHIPHKLFIAWLSSNTQYERLVAC